MGNLVGWPYWKDISITGQSGAGTDYQVELEIGDSAGGDFHLEGHCTNFPQDIRITDDDGITLLDHWVEDITADPIKVWVEVKDDLGSDRDIRVYYGKSGETTASNGANTFIQYDGITGTPFLKPLDISIPFIYEGRGKRTSSNAQIYFGTSNYQNCEQLSPEPDTATVTPYDAGTVAAVQNDNVQSVGANRTTWTVNQYYNVKIIAISSSLVTMYTGDGTSDDLTTNVPDENMGMVYYEHSGSGEQKWSFVRKYNSPEPAFSSAGAEQTPTGVSPTGVFYGPLVGPFGGPI